jgi:hypothetical protein
LRFLLPAIFCLVTGSALAQGPFTPPGVKPPDYAATMAIGGAFNRPGNRIVLHHGDWTWVGASRDTPNAKYYLANEAVTITVGDHAFSLLRGPDHSLGTDYTPRNTGERQTHLGESCTVWQISRRKVGPRDEMIGSSCVTDDGIELWQKVVSSFGVISSAEATQIARQPIAPEDVRPPPSVFAVDWPAPDALPAIPPEKPDHEVVLEMAGPSGAGGTTIRTVRRHGPWQLTEEITGKLRRIRISHDFEEILLAYDSDEAGAPKRLFIHSFAPTAAQQAEILAARLQPVDQGRGDMALGEACRWFNMMPGAADAGSSSCLTDDHIAVKETSFHRSSHLREWTAIRLVRRPIAVDEIKPPAELLSPQTWGVD